jgi:hypothetical protein
MIGTEMFNFDDDKYEWKEDANGNYVYIYSDDIGATVFRKSVRTRWKITINTKGIGRIVANEAFDALEDAKKKAEDILIGGASCTLILMKPTRGTETTNWQTLEGKYNNSPMFGRKYKGLSVNVKMAITRTWFYEIDNGVDVPEPQGRFQSLEMAMKAFEVEQR